MRPLICSAVYSFFFNDTATTEIYTLSLHDALPIRRSVLWRWAPFDRPAGSSVSSRSEEHTSELQSRVDLVCRLLLEKKKMLLLRVLGLQITVIWLIVCMWLR